MVLPHGPNQRWSLDFVSGCLICSRPFHILNLVDDFSRECLVLVADTLLSGARVACEPISSAILRWSQDGRRSNGIISHRTSQWRTAWWQASMAVCPTTASMRCCSPRWLTPGSCSLPGGTTTTPQATLETGREDPRRDRRRKFLRQAPSHVAIPPNNNHVGERPDLCIVTVRGTLRATQR